jgi:DNA-binding XRE family transcriptional regulator
VKTRGELYFRLLSGSRTMEHEDKVSAAALHVGTMSVGGGVHRALGRVDAPQGTNGETPLGGVVSVQSPALEDDREKEREAKLVADESSTDKPERSSKNAKKANNVRRIRIERMMSKAELARRANLSVLTIDRVERGYGCRMDTKRKILEALGLSLADRVRVFGEEE